MKRSIRVKIIFMMIIASVLPPLFIFFITMFQQDQVERQVGNDIHTMSLNNFKSIADNMYGLCETSNILMQQEIEIIIGFGMQLIEDRGFRFSDEKVRWQAVDQFSGKTKTVLLPKFIIDSKWLGKVVDPEETAPFVDKIVRDTDGAVTVFQRMNERGDMLRISTSVIKNNKRAIGTYIPAINPDGSANPVVSALLSRNTYKGNASVVGIDYKTMYKPILDNKGEVVGAIFFGIKQLGVDAFRNTMVKTKIGKTGYIYASYGPGKNGGELVLHPDARLQGQNLWNMKDGDGEFFVQKIANKAENLQGKDIDTQYYKWKNTKTGEINDKIVIFTYYRPWNWIIGVSVTLDEFREVERKASSAIGKLMLYIGIVALVLIAIMTVIAVVFGKRIAHAIQMITDGAKRLARGDAKLEGTDHSLMLEIAGRNDELGETGRSLIDLVKYFQDKADVSDKIAVGDFSTEVSIVSEDDTLGHAMAQMKSAIEKVIRDIDETQKEQLAGDYEALIDSSQYNGAFKQVVEGFNGALQFQVDNLGKILETAGAYGKGDLTVVMEQFPGKLGVANDRLNEVRDNLRNIADEILGLANEALNGNLANRGAEEKFAGVYKEMVRGINQTLDAVIEPVNEASSVLAKMAEGNLATFMEGQYKGDHAQIKQAMNETLNSLNQLLQMISQAIDQVAEGSNQVSASSQSLSQGATEQASSLEEISASVVEIGSQTRQNSENASEANRLAKSVSTAATGGNEQMGRMLTAIKEINVASAEVQHIIKTIDEIAFQTNLLALNAAVEAARAGVHGKGFAVVAEEVRNLAQRSAQAAHETTEIIEGSVVKAANGTSIAEETAVSLHEIITGIEKVSSFVNDIDQASLEQQTGIQQISEALTQVDQVTQANTASAEESAATAEELSGQANQIRGMIARFTLKNMSFSSQKQQKKNLSSTAPKNLLPKNEAPTKVQNPNEIISLDDDDFLNF